jgi:hypothetical protein
LPAWMDHQHCWNSCKANLSAAGAQSWQSQIWQLKCFWVVPSWTRVLTSKAFKVPTRPGRSGPSTHTGVKFDRSNVRASHGLDGVMQSLRRGDDPSSRYGFLSLADFLSAAFSRQQIPSVDISS